MSDLINVIGGSQLHQQHQQQQQQQNVGNVGGQMAPLTPQTPSSVPDIIFTGMKYPQHTRDFFWSLRL